MNILIAVGTVYGGAGLVADELQNSLENLGHTVIRPDETTGSDLAADDLDLLLVCTSTTGSGDLPDDIVGLHTELVDAPPRIFGLKYAVIALGDSSYDTFCGGGLAMDEALMNAGAEQVAEPLRLDAMETVTPEEDAVPWILELMETL